VPDKKSKAVSVSPEIGVGVLVWKNKKLLLGKRINKDKSYCWQFPGGRLENNESIIECARREVWEETGLQVKQLRHLGFVDKPFEMCQQQYITLLVSAEYASAALQVLEPDKCEIWQWFDHTSLPAPLFLPITLFLEQQGELKHHSRKKHSRGIASSRNSESYVDLYALHCAAEVMPSGDDKSECK